ncbi:MAG: hypothetical protein ACTHL8_16710 [Burkholderiaceae bacterium]
MAASAWTALAAGGCAQAPAGAGPVVLAPALVAAPQGLPAVTLASRGVAWHGCADLLAALRADRVPEEAVELPEFNAYAGCQAAALVARGRRADDLDASDAGARLYHRLDLATVPSSLAQARPADHYHLDDFKSAQVALGPSSVTLRDHGFFYEMRVLAVGDFRHAGHGEFLVRFVERSETGGSYDRTAVLVVDPAPGGGLVATDALDVLRGDAGR